MSSHIWDTKKFSAHTLEEGQRTWDIVIKECLPYQLSCQLVAYLLERCRQNGSRWAGFVRTEDGTNRFVIRGYAKECLEAARRGSWKFSRGKNAENYFVAGERLLTALAEEYTFELGTPAPVLFDYLTKKWAEEFTFIAPSPRK